MPSSQARRALCIYCRKQAGSEEHVIATRFIQVLHEDPRGLPVPIRLTITLPDETQRNIGGKKTKRGHYTLEYTTRVCAPCNRGWMNDVDTAAYPYLAEMIRGRLLTLDGPARSAVAAWICKVAVTARSAPHPRLPIEKEWTDWLYVHHTALPTWKVWIGRYEGSQPWWYSPHDVRIELGVGSAPPPPGFVRTNGVLATLVIGYLVLQVFGIGGRGVLYGPEEPAFPRIWPPQGVSTVVLWPPPEHIDDAGLPLWAERILHKPPA